MEPTKHFRPNHNENTQKQDPIPTNGLSIRTHIQKKRWDCNRTHSNNSPSLYVFGLVRSEYQFVCLSGTTVRRQDYQDEKQTHLHYNWPVRKLYLCFRCYVQWAHNTNKPVSAKCLLPFIFMMVSLDVQLHQWPPCSSLISTESGSSDDFRSETRLLLTIETSFLNCGISGFFRLSASRSLLLRWMLRRIGGGSCDTKRGNPRVGGLPRNGRQEAWIGFRLFNMIPIHVLCKIKAISSLPVSHI